MNIIIRHEEEKDYKRVEEVAREAFWNLYFPGAHEHYVVRCVAHRRNRVGRIPFIGYRNFS